GLPGRRQERGRAGREGGPGGIIDVWSEGGEALPAQETAGPEAQLLRTDVGGIPRQAPVRRDFVPPAGRHALEGLQQVDVQHHAFLPEIVSQPTPATSEPGAGPEVAPPAGGD